MSEAQILAKLQTIEDKLDDVLGRTAAPGETVPGVPATGPLTLGQARQLAASSSGIVLLGMEFPKEKPAGVWKFGSNALGPFGMSHFYRDAIQA